MATVADLVRLQRQAIISGRVALPSITRVMPESARQVAARAMASQAIYAGGLSQRQNDMSVSAQSMPPPRASMLGALQRERLKPCPTGYQRDARGECIIVIETSTVANAIPAEYLLGPTLSQFRPVLNFNAAVPGRSTTESLQAIKRNLGQLSKGLNGLNSTSKMVAMRATRSGLAGLGVLALSVTTSPTPSTGTVTLTTTQIIDGLNVQITSLNSQVTKLQADYAALDAACQKSTDAALSCNATLATTKAALDAANARIATLTAQVASLTDKLNTVIAEATSMKRLLAERDATITSINATLADLRSQLAVAQASITDLTSKLTFTNGALTTAQTREREVSLQLIDASAQNAILRDQLAAAIAQRDALKAERDQLASAVGAATAQLASANSAIAALKAVCSALSAQSAVTMNGLGLRGFRGGLRGLGEMIVPTGPVTSGGAVVSGDGLAIRDLPNYEMLYADCIKLAKKIKDDLDAKMGFIDPKDCPTSQQCPECPTTESTSPNWLPLAVVGISAAKLFL